jgi:hypothetical protein
VSYLAASETAFAVLNSLDIAIPNEIFRRQSPASQREVMPVQPVFN